MVKRTLRFNQLFPNHLRDARPDHLTKNKPLKSHFLWDGKPVPYNKFSNHNNSEFRIPNYHKGGFYA